MLAPKCTLQGLRNTLTVSSESTKHKEQCIYYYLTKETTTARIAMCLEPSLAATLKSLNCNPVASNSFLKKKQLQNDKKYIYIYNYIYITPLFSRKRCAHVSLMRSLLTFRRAFLTLPSAQPTPVAALPLAASLGTTGRIQCGPMSRCKGCTQMNV